MQRPNARQFLLTTAAIREMLKAGRSNSTPLGTSQFRADRPFSHSPCNAPAGLDGRSLTITKD